MIAVVLAGGRARRLAGRHKPAIEVAGVTLLDRALYAVSDADPIIVVGPRQPTSVGVRWTREQPHGGGPVAAIASGLAIAPDDGQTVVLAADLVGINKATIARLRTELAEHPAVDGVVLRDATGRTQWLIGIWRTAALRAALPESPRDRSLGSVLGALVINQIAALPGESADIDTPADLAAAEQREDPASPQSHR
jgi:molybdopterin-guanine dinucleotide biosynthesis protein A